MSDETGRRLVLARREGYVKAFIERENRPYPEDALATMARNASRRAFPLPSRKEPRVWQGKSAFNEIDPLSVAVVDGDIFYSFSGGTNTKHFANLRSVIIDQNTLLTAEVLVANIERIVLAVQDLRANPWTEVPDDG